MPAPNPVARQPDETERGGARPPTTAFAFRLAAVSGVPVARLVGDGESPLIAMALRYAHLQGQGADDGAARRSVIEEAHAWLGETLMPAPGRQRSCQRRLPPGDRRQHPLFGAQS